MGAALDPMRLHGTFDGLADWSAFGRSAPAPCPSDFDPMPTCGCEVTEPDLLEYVDTAITALQTVQQLQTAMHNGKTDRRDFLPMIERMKGLLDVAREALEDAPL